MRRATTLLVAAAAAASCALLRAAPPCCRLTGRWQVDLTLDSAGQTGGVARVRQLAAGAVTFGDSLRPQARWLLRKRPGQISEELGVSAIDLEPMLGPGYRPGSLIRELRSIQGADVDTTLATATLASTFEGDSVTIDFMPTIDHYGLLLNGRIRGDSITGAWVQKRYCCGAYGRFVIRRIP